MEKHYQTVVKKGSSGKNGLIWGFAALGVAAAAVFLMKGTRGGDSGQDVDELLAAADRAAERMDHVLKREA